MLCDPSIRFESDAHPNGYSKWSNGTPGVVSWNGDPFAPFKTVGDAEAERLFRSAFGGRGVEEVLKDEAGKDSNGHPVQHGLFAQCIREATFNRLLLAAREQLDAQRMIGVGEKTTVVSREKMTTKHGRGFLKVKTVTYWRDGRVETDVTMKQMYRL